MKKKFLLLPCIAAVAIATFVGTKTLKSNAYSANSLLLQNVEALTDDNEADDSADRNACLQKGGNWNMASVCKASGFENAKCEISGEVTVCGVTVKGNYSRGSKYRIAWARYECVESKGNCCVKQGLYTGETKLA